MTIRDKLNADPGFNYVIDSMELMSSTGRRFLMQQPLLTDALLLEKEYSNIDRVKAVLTEECRQQSVSTLLHQLMQMHDLQGTLLNLQHHMTLEEIELFEIKSFAFPISCPYPTSMKYSTYSTPTAPTYQASTSTTAIIPTFQIYDDNLRPNRHYWKKVSPRQKRVPPSNNRSTACSSNITPYSIRSSCGCLTTCRASTPPYRRH